jgi:hypothetical protein
MRPTRCTSYLLLAMHFLAGALRARSMGGDVLTKLSQLRAANARACFREWLYHSRKAGAFSESASLPLS